MAFERGFKRLAAPEQLKLSAISAANSTDGEDSPVCARVSFSFDALKRKLGIGFGAQLQHSAGSVADWFDRSAVVPERRARRKKYNTKKGGARAVRFLYVYKTPRLSDSSASALFKELIDLIN